MTINIFVSPINVKIEGKQFQYSMLAKDNNEDRFRKFVEDNIPKTCGLINLYCSSTNNLDTILEVVSYAHRIGAGLTVFKYDILNLKKLDDWDKINKYIEYKTHIVF